MKKLLLAAMATAFASSAFAQETAANQEAAAGDDAAQCKVVIEGNDAMQYNIDNFTINKEACAEFTIELHHVGNLPKNAMGHNVVVAQTGDFEAIAADGIGAGIDNNYLKPEDERVIAHTDVVGGGEQTEVTFSTADLEAGGDYTFFCSFPGHSSIMKGSVTVE